MVIVARGGDGGGKVDVATAVRLVAATSAMLTATVAMMVAVIAAVLALALGLALVLAQDKCMCRCEGLVLWTAKWLARMGIGRGKRRAPKKTS